MPRLIEITRRLATAQRDAAIEALRLRDQQRELRAELAALDAEQSRVRSELAEARVSRVLDRRPTTAKIADERIGELESALADMTTRAQALREALVRVSVALRTAQHGAGLADRAAAEAEARAIVRQMVPIVTALEPLNQQLEALHSRLGRSSAPMPFRVLLQPVVGWLQTARAFIGDL